MATQQPEEQTAEWVLEQYKCGRHDFTDIELPESSSLRGADLSSADFSGSWLSLIDFSDANLEQSAFSRLQREVLDFRNANLKGASFD